MAGLTIERRLLGPTDLRSGLFWTHDILEVDFEKLLRVDHRDGRLR